MRLPEMRRDRDLVVAVIVGWLGVIFAAFSEGPVLALLSLTALFGPAYVVSVALFPSATEQEGQPPRGVFVGPERIVFVAFLGVASIIVAAQLAARVGLPLSRTIVPALAAFAASAALVYAVSRRPRDALPRRPLPVPRVVLAMCIGGFVVVLATGVVVAPRLYQDPHHTEVLLLPSSGNVTDLAHPIPSEAQTYTLELLSHEDAVATYNISWYIDNGTSMERSSFVHVTTIARGMADATVRPGERQVLTLQTPPLPAGLHFWTIDVAQTAPRAQTVTLHVWLMVDAAPAPAGA